MTYYRVKKYLMERGLTEGQADRVRGFIRQMINEAVDEDRYVNPSVDNPSDAYPEGK